MPRKIIEVKGLSKTYNGLKAVDNVSFEVIEGEIFGIVGPNGAGKTTLVECIEGLKTPTKGHIKMLGLDMIKSSKEARQKIKQHIGIQLQEGKLPDRIKVLEAIELFASFYNHSLPPKLILKYMNLTNKSHSYFEALSGGQKQRLFIGLSLINNPKLIFLDELTTGLDPHSRRKMWDLVKKIRDKGKTIVIITHFMEEAEYLCDRVAIIDHGKIIALDTPSNLINALGVSTQISFISDDSFIVDKIQMLGFKIEKTDKELVIYCKDKSQITPVINTLIEEAIDFKNLSIKNPNLEDVFISLTGSKIRD